MIKVPLTNEILKYITEIDKNRYTVSSVKLSKTVANRLRKNSKKKSSYASNKIEGNPLSEQQANDVIEADEHKHFLKPEQEVRNYFLALNHLEQQAEENESFPLPLPSARNGPLVLSMRPQPFLHFPFPPVSGFIAHRIRRPDAWNHARGCKETVKRNKLTLWSPAACQPYIQKSEVQKTPLFCLYVCLRIRICTFRYLPLTGSE